MMTVGKRIEAALGRLGEPDALAWAGRHPTTALHELNTTLNAGVAPVDLEQYLADAALRCGRFDEFARAQAVRTMHERHVGRNGFTLWSFLFDRTRHSDALAVWEALEEAMRLDPDWLPKSPDDPRVLEAFRGVSFQPGSGKVRLDEATRRAFNEAERDNDPYQPGRAVRNLAVAPRVLRWLYGFYAVHGQVSNGGFGQYYENTGGWPTAFAVEALREMGCAALADIVAESLALIVRECPDFLEHGVDLGPCAGIETPRDLDELDSAYIAASEALGSEWPESSLIDLVERYDREPSRGDG